MTAGLEFGFYGKLPALGDFVTRNMQRDVSRRVDQWMRDGMNHSRSLNDAWLDAYLVAPVWCFFAGAGVWGNTPCCGLLMPSVDRVGRYFPLFVMAPLRPGEHDIAQLPGALSDLALELPRVLHERLDADQTLTLLGAVKREPDQELSGAELEMPEQQSRWWIAGQAMACALEHSGRSDNALFNELFIGYRASSAPLTT